MFTLTFNEQRLLFEESRKIVSSTTNEKVPEKFYTQGYAIIENIATPQDAYAILESLISSIDKQKVSLFSHFASRVQLAKADLIPVCDDVVESSFQVLHLDMGQPIISKKPQTMYLITGLY